MCQFASGLLSNNNPAVTHAFVYFLCRPICYKIWTRGSTADVDPTPFLVGCGSTFLWLRYSLLLEDATMTGCNVAGLSAFSCYLLFYYAMCSNKYRISMKIFSLICVLTAIVLLCSSRGPDQIYWSAMFACTSSMVSCASPLAGLKRVLRTKSCDSLPFTFIAFSFMNSIAWSCYGLLANNNFIIFPNAVGGAIAFSQLLLFLVFPSGRSPANKEVRFHIHLPFCIPSSLPLLPILLSKMLKLISHLSSHRGLTERKMKVEFESRVHAFSPLFSLLFASKDGRNVLLFPILY